MTHASRPDQIPLLADENAFVDWRTDARPGDRFVYHRGFLARDRHPTTGRMGKSDRLALERVADRAFGACNQRLVRLLQRKHGPEDFSYIAVARAPPAPERNTRITHQTFSPTSPHGGLRL